MRIEVISNHSELLNKKLKIYNITKKYSFFQSFDFIYRFMQMFPERKYLIIFSENENGQIFIPLYRFRYFLINCYGFIGSPNFNEENFLCHSYEGNKKKLIYDLKIIFKKLELDKKCLYFNNLNQYTYEMLDSLNLSLLRSYQTNTININQNNFWETNEIKNKLFKNIDFKVRKFCNQHKADIDQIKLNRIHTNSIDVKKFILNNKILNNNHRKILSKNIDIFLNLSNGVNDIEFSSLEYKNIILSIIIGLRYNNKYYYCIPTFNKKFKKYSFGLNHLIKLILLKKKRRYFIF